MLFIAMLFLAFLFYHSLFLSPTLVSEMLFIEMLFITFLFLAFLVAIFNSPSQQERHSTRTRSRTFGMFCTQHFSLVLLLKQLQKQKISNLNQNDTSIIKVFDCYCLCRLKTLHLYALQYLTTLASVTLISDCINPLILASTSVMLLVLCPNTASALHLLSSCCVVLPTSTLQLSY